MMLGFRFVAASSLAVALAGGGCEKNGPSSAPPEPAAPRPVEAEPGEVETPSSEPAPPIAVAPTDDGGQEPPPPAKAGEACGNGVSCDEGLGCSGLEFDAPGSCIPETDAKAQCASSGGEWGKWGMRGARYCMALLPDGGKACTDSGQCAGNCIGQPGANSGECQKYKTQFGCYSVLEGGQAKGAICVD